MEKKKKTIDVKFIITNISIIGLGVSILWTGMKYAAESETKMFESPSQREKTRQHIDSDYNEVRNYQLMEQVTEMKVELDTAYAFVNAMFKEDRAARRLDSINSASAIKSRKARDSIVRAQAKTIENIQREQRITSNAVQLILAKLDTLN